MKALILLLALFDCKVHRVIDGDTVVVDVEVAKEEKIWFHDRRIRFNRTFAPEIREWNGRAYRTFVEQWVKRQRSIRYEPKGYDKYGRMLGELHGSDGTIVNDEVLKALGVELWIRNLLHFVYPSN